jgi:hypothetical protein
MTAHRIQVLGNTEAVRLTPNGDHSGMDITLQNINPSGYIYIGGEGVTTLSYGFRIMPSHSISFELPGYDALYAIASSADMNLAILETGLEVGQ